MSTKKESTSEKLVKRDIEALRENDEQLASMKEEVSTKKEKWNFENLICKLPHCRCMQQSPCSNHHYSDECFSDNAHSQSESIEWEKEWVEKKKEILGLFNAGQSHLLTQNGSVTLSAGQQREEGEYNCRDAKKLVERTEQFFLKAITTAVAKRELEIAEENAEVYKWLLGMSGDFPQSEPGARYNWRAELRKRIPESILSIINKKV